MVNEIDEKIKEIVEQMKGGKAVRRNFEDIARPKALILYVRELAREEDEIKRRIIYLLYLIEKAKAYRIEEEYDTLYQFLHEGLGKSASESSELSAAVMFLVALPDEDLARRIIDESPDNIAKLRSVAPDMRAAYKAMAENEKRIAEVRDAVRYYESIGNEEKAADLQESLEMHIASYEHAKEEAVREAELILEELVEPKHDVNGPNSFRNAFRSQIGHLQETAPRYEGQVVYSSNGLVRLVVELPETEAKKAQALLRSFVDWRLQ